ncbi:MAG TPA: signal peptidase II [Anaerolineales bacterium]|nr:signal peptidase II [Anaerolineae bacterium]HRJ58507.1 signal peptidase II [Anaerolineales bacterium]HRK89128.1 signal peptidase II [Anaerolineales bacterium]
MSYFLFFGVAGISIALDQWTKWWVRTNIEFAGQWLPEWLAWLSPYARFVHWYNSGAAFGMFQNGNLVFTILAFIVIGALVYYFPQAEQEDWTLKLAMGLQLGGATGNLIDRLLMGKVTDFISILRLPVFNIADASITVGVLVLLLGVWINERREKMKSGGTPPAVEAPMDSVKEG